jgi:hypothetical protein
MEQIICSRVCSHPGKIYQDPRAHLPKLWTAIFKIKWEEKTCTLLSYLMSTFPIGNFAFNFHYSLIFNLGSIFLDMCDICEHLVFNLGYLYKLSWVWERICDLPKDRIHSYLSKGVGGGRKQWSCFSDLQISCKGKNHNSQSHMYKMFPTGFILEV